MAGATVRFGDAAGLSVTFVSPLELGVTSPAAAPGPVDVRVTNPDGQEVRFASYTYVAPPPPPGRDAGVSWCKLGGEVVAAPEDLLGRALVEGPAIYAQIYLPGVTDSAGAGAAITAELGVGDAGSAVSSWAWRSSTFQRDTGTGANDEYVARLPPLPPGEYQFAFRARYKDSDWLLCDADGTATGGFTIDQCGRESVDAVASCRLDSVSASSLASGDTVSATPSVSLPTVSSTPGPVAGRRAEFGVGPQGDDASKNVGWGWKAASFAGKGADGGVDRYAATLQPAYTGTRAVSFRVAAPDSGRWTYCDLNGSDLQGYETSQQWNVAVSDHLDLDFCNLQFPATLSLPADGGALVFGRVYQQGATPNPAWPIVAELGWGSASEDPGLAWSWSPAAFNVVSGNDNEYAATFKAPPGTWDYAFRFSLDGGHICYADLDGHGKNGVAQPWSGFSGQTTTGAPNLGRATVTP